MLSLRPARVAMQAAARRGASAQAGLQVPARCILAPLAPQQQQPQIRRMHAIARRPASSSLSTLAAASAAPSSSSSLSAAFSRSWATTPRVLHPSPLVLSLRSQSFSSSQRGTHVSGGSHLGGNPFSPFSPGSGGFGGGGGGDGGFGGGGPPQTPWKALAVLGGLVIGTVTGGLLVASLLSPWLLGALGAWWAWRAYKRWKVLYDSAGGAAAGEANPFRRGPWTKEAREAKALRQAQMGDIFQQLSPALRNMFASAAMVARQRQAMQQAAAAAAAAASGAADVTSSSAFLQRKLRATLLHQVLRHPAVRKHLHLRSAEDMPHTSPHTLAHQIQEQVVSVNGVARSLLTVAEAFDLGKGCIVEARYALKIDPQQQRQLARELDEWVAASNVKPQGGVETVLHEPLPFSGELFDQCVIFESVVLRPPGHGGAAHPIDLLADPEFKQGNLGGKVMEAEYEEIKKY